MFSGFEAKSKTVPGISAMISETKLTVLFFYLVVVIICTVKLALTELRVLYISMEISCKYVSMKYHVIMVCFREIREYL